VGLRGRVSGRGGGGGEGGRGARRGVEANLNPSPGMLSCLGFS
jgi:hypothetical protein